jgi:polysaccharide deacetylase 2 family uncharacterized protein YibQ
MEHASMSAGAETPESNQDATDDLSKPLGTAKPKRKRSLVVPGWIVSRAIAGALALCVAVLGGWILFVNEPYGGEPMTIVSADPRGAPPAKAGEKAGEKPGEPAPSNAAATTPGAAGEKPGDGQTVTIIDGSTGKRQEVTVTPPGAKNTRPDAKPADGKLGPRSDVIIDQRLIETSRHGAIPKIAADGTRPADVYAKPVKAQAGRTDAKADAKPDGPRVAIVLEGLGVGANVTAEALAKLPPEVTYAFTPYGTDIERWVNRARSEGHEVLLQVGMEPLDYPDNDPGPQTLLTSLSADQNVDRLHWFMSRFQGYVGITSLMGARFTATDLALGPVLREIGRRGLIYFDDGASPRSVAGQIAGASNLSYARAETVLDAVPTASEIDGALARLEATARARGVAIASASVLPVTIDRISQWVRGAEDRGIVLVPVSAVASRVKTAS